VTRLRASSMLASDRAERSRVQQRQNVTLNGNGGRLCGIGESMIDYKSFPGLAGVFLEDSYVLGISETSEQVVFHLDAVLTPEHPAYHPPCPGEQYCYANGSLIFPDVTRVVWLKRTSSHYTDASGEEDLGNIDILRPDGDAFVAEGDWGAVRIAGAQPRFELSG
jgi:hypothetical protein